MVKILLKIHRLVGVASYKVFVIEFGLLGFILVFGILAVSAFIKNKKNIEGVFFIIVFFLSVYQRINIIILIYMILLFGGITYLNDKKMSQKNTEIEVLK